MGQHCPRNFNPADFFISVLAVDPEREAECRDFVHKVCDAFQASTEGQQSIAAARTNMTSEGTDGTVLGSQSKVSLVLY